MSEEKKSNLLKYSVLKFFGQLILIVFSVVLGLYLSQRIEEGKNEKDSQELFVKIHSELKRNKKILDHWVPYHKEVLDKIDSLKNDKVCVEDFVNDKTEIYKAFGKGTIMSDMPSNDAWDIAKAHPLIVNMDYNQLIILSKIYNQQTFTYESILKLIDVMISPDFNKKTSAKQNLRLFRDKLGEVYGRELQLISYYDQAEKFLKNKK